MRTNRFNGIKGSPLLPNISSGTVTLLNIYRNVSE